MSDHGRLSLQDPSGALEATFLTRLGMVVSSLRFEGEELLGLRGGPEAYAERGSTFGIPLLHPWANRLSAWEYTAGGRSVTLHPDSPVTHIDGASGLPSHGLLAASPDWVVRDHDAASVIAELDFGADPALMAAFPFAHRLTYRAVVRAAGLTVWLTVTPSGDDPVPIAFGFHPYLTLPGSDRAHWHLTLPVARRAVLSEHGLPTGEVVDVAPGALDGPLGDRAFDDCYDRLAAGGEGIGSGGPGSPAFAVADGRRRIEVAFLEGFPVAQVYSPGGADFICFEPMTAPVDALRTGEGLRHAAPGEPFTAAFRISAGAVSGSGG